MSNNLALLAGLLMLVSAVAGTGCRSARSKRTAGVKEGDSVSALVTGKKMFPVQAFDFSWFAAHGKTVYSSNGQDVPLTLSIRMQKDSLIWISVTALFGIEVARVLITPDSVFVLDRIHRKYFAKDYAFIREQTKTSVTDLNIGMLQALLLGNNTMAEKNIDLADTLDGFNILRSTSGGYENTVFINPKDTKIAINWLKDVMKGQELKVTYSEFSKEGGQLFPHHVFISTISSKEKVDARITYDKVSLERIESFPFSIPSGYHELK